MSDPPRSSPSSLFFVFFRLGLTSFGGPIAHLGYFREEFVSRRAWVSDQAYADLVALCQFLPGPASSQVGFAVGLLRGGLPGGLAAWLGFTLPSAVLLFVAALGIAFLDGPIALAAIEGLKIVAVAVVAHALWGMSRSLCPDGVRIAIAFCAMAGVLLIPSPIIQLIVIGFAGVAGGLWCPSGGETSPSDFFRHRAKVPAALAIIVFFVLLFGLPLATSAVDHPLLGLADGFYRAGALVFGGGHVVLPLLDAQVAQPNGISDSTFLAGYGAAQAVPGPLFTFAAYLGALAPGPYSPVIGASVGLVAVFLPGLLLVYGVLPFWQSLTQAGRSRAALNGVNAGVVGILAAALYTPIWTSAITQPSDFLIASGTFLLLVVRKSSPGVVVLVAVSASIGLSLFD